MKTGTCYFPTYGAAMRYYRPQEETRGDTQTRTAAIRRLIDEKLNEGAIHIGKPPLREGERLVIEDNRYYIITGGVK